MVVQMLNSSSRVQCNVEQIKGKQISKSLGLFFFLFSFFKQRDWENCTSNCLYRLKFQMREFKKNSWYNLSHMEKTVKEVDKSQRTKNTEAELPKII